MAEEQKKSSDPSNDAEAQPAPADNVTANKQATPNPISQFKSEWRNRGGLHTSLPLSTSRHSLHQFQRTTEEAAVERLGAHVENLVENEAASALPEKDRERMIKQMDGFVDLFAKYIEQRGKRIDWTKIKPPPAQMVKRLQDLPQCTDEQKKSLLSKLVVLKLNGGLGTTMGCTGPKSAIEVHSGFTFLDLTVHQIQVRSQFFLFTLLIQFIALKSRT